MEIGFMGIVDGSHNTVLALKNGFDCAFTWMHNTNDTVSVRRACIQLVNLSPIPMDTKGSS